jgi:hypothetical protein
MRACKMDACLFKGERMSHSEVSIQCQIVLKITLDTYNLTIVINPLKPGLTHPCMQ